MGQVRNAMRNVTFLRRRREEGLYGLAQQLRRRMAERCSDRGLA
jgi:hypothetical protein